MTSAGARVSPWFGALGPGLPSQLIALLSKDGSDNAVDTWCWQALYLLQSQLSSSQLEQILQHPTAQRVCKLAAAKWHVKHCCVSHVLPTLLLDHSHLHPKKQQRSQPA